MKLDISQVHETWLEYGPSTESVRRANADVRQCLSDMGTEFAIANFPDIVTEYMDNKDIDTDGCYDQFLYPFAMQVPGLQHIVDWVVLEGTSKLTFFAEWQQKSKSVLQYVHSSNHRGHMEDIVKADMSLSSTQADDIARSLARAPGRFAKLRWKTLNTALADLFHLETAMKLVMDAVDTGDASLGIRDGAKTLSIKEAIKDEDFWQQARAIHVFVKPLLLFSSWCQGCDCHEPDLMKHGPQVQRSFKGCRARSIAKQVDTVLQQLNDIRQSLKSDQFGDTTTLCLTQAITQVIAGFHLKMRWVNELPYLIWQAIGYNVVP